MTKRELLKFIAKLILTSGILFVVYQNHFTVSTAGTVSIGGIILILFIFFKNYKDIKDWCLEEMMRLRESDNMRIKTPRREFFAWLFIWSQILIPIYLFYRLILYLKETNQTMESSLFQILVISCIAATVAFLSMFADNSN